MEASPKIKKLFLLKVITLLKERGEMHTKLEGLGLSLSALDKDVEGVLVDCAEIIVTGEEDIFCDMLLDYIYYQKIPQAMDREVCTDNEFVDYLFKSYGEEKADI